MNWQDYYAVAKSLRERSDWLFDRGEHQYASEGVWGALQYAARALKGRYGAVAGNLALERGYLPGKSNSRAEVEVRTAQWGSAKRLHRHFYNSNLPAARLAESRNEAAALLDEAFGALDA